MKINMALVFVGVCVVAVIAVLFIRMSPTPVTAPVPSGAPITSTTTKTPIGVVSPPTTTAPQDETWQTYTSKTGDFSFQFPTRGRYVPTWEVSFSDHDCAGVSKGEPARKTINGITFCQASATEGAAGSAYRTDTYTTLVGSRYVVISFVKRLYSAGALDCSFVGTFPYSTSASTCIPFEDDAYQSQLDQIMSTFQVVRA